jgi:pyridoxal phosphate enzyme (YggS family)
MTGENNNETNLSRNLEQVLSELDAVTQEVGRDPASVNLVVVSKTKPAEEIIDVLMAGQRIFGENRVQEAEQKWPQLKRNFGDVRLHLIGPLQSNKVRQAVGLFDVIETVDRPKLARALARIMAETGLKPDCLIQVNTGEEDQKAGVKPHEADDFISLCRDQLKLPVRGLMCIPPVEDEPSLHFARLSQIAERNGLEQLSMGMSADYPVAVRCGATYVRIGTAIFGERC